MELKELAAKATMAAWRDEIERAITNAKRTEWDKRFRRAWYRAEARSKARDRGRWPKRNWPRRGPGTGRRAWS